MLVALFVLGVFLAPAEAQTYKVNQGAPPTKQQDEQTQNPNQNSQQKPLGWGSNIQTARLARAAETALKSGHYAQAVDYAQRAADSSPNDPHLWFLLGYCARLARRTQVSLDAYDRGLKVSPGSLEGLSGLAQTYSLMGKNDEAERLLTQVVAADPKRVNDEQMLGEIYLRSGNYDQAISVLGRAEQIQPEGRTELLIALSYQRLKKYDEANHYLEVAKKRAPNNPEVQRALSGFYRETGNYQAAIAALKSIA